MLIEKVQSAMSAVAVKEGVMVSVTTCCLPGSKRVSVDVTKGNVTVGFWVSREKDIPVKMRRLEQSMQRENMV